MMTRQQDSRRNAIGLGAVMVVLLAAILLAGSFYHHSLRASETMVREQMRLLSSQAARDIEDMLSDCTVELEWMSRLPEVRDAQPGSAVTVFDEELRDKPYFTSLFRLDAKGICTLYYSHHKDALQGVVGKDFSFRDYYQAIVRTGKSAVSAPEIAGGPYPDVTNKYRALMLAVPLRDAQRNFAGVVGADVGITSMAQRFIDPLSLAHQGGAWLITADGFIVTDPDKRLLGQRLPGVTAALDEGSLLALLARRDGATMDVLREVAVATLGSARWFVVLEVPRRYAQELVAPLYRRLVALMCCVTLVITGGIVSQVITLGRMARLRRQVHDLEIRIDEGRKHQEVAQITSSDYFQSLLDKVDTLRQEQRSG